MTPADAEAKAREIHNTVIPHSVDCWLCGKVAAALLAAANERCQGCLSSDYCPEHDVHKCRGRCGAICGCTHYEGDECATAIRARGGEK